MVKINPTYLSKIINFHLDNKEWKYNPEDEPTMQKLQAEGAAKAWNIMQDHGIAIIADEVGMGKTTQALAIMVNLWLQKPEAKIMLFAPNEGVALKWKKEYENFIRYHLRNADNKVKSTITGNPLHSAVFCNDHLELLLKIKDGWPSFIINKTSTLSHLASTKITNGKLEELGLKFSRKYPEDESDDDIHKFTIQVGIETNRMIKNNLCNGEELDLLIIDEAHYLRNASGDTNRSKSAYAMFTGIDCSKDNPTASPLAKNVLLMTATPNHSTSNDITHMVAYFKPEWKHKTPEQILELICVRRLRRLAGKTKKEYRHEKPEGVKMESLSERLFFAAYHKSLVSQQTDKNNKLKTEGKTIRRNPYEIMTGYLEGFEFLPNSLEKEKETGDDFNFADDSQVIIHLSNEYIKCYKEPPHHPKYDALISRLSPLNNNGNKEKEKNLVFVRRIPSVREIAKRVIFDYDQWLLGILKPKGYKNKTFDFRKLRKLYWKKIRNNKEELEEQKAVSKNDDSDQVEGIPPSTILDLFVVKKPGPTGATKVKYRSTDCSNFRLRFTKEFQVFSVFFEPCADYQYNSYQLKTLIKSADGKKTDFLKSVQLARYISNPNLHSLAGFESHLYAERGAYEEKTNLRLDTLLSIYFRIVANRSSSFYNAIVLKEYDSWSWKEKEGFSEYLSKGILLASTYIVFMYSWYEEAKKKNVSGNELYLEFCKLVNENIVECGLADIITRALLGFKIFYTKELGKKSDELLQKNNFNFLNNVPPVYPYYGATKRPTILKAFNSPFFPHDLVATSVLQEGVDLHYQCSSVIHYGIAWTQGDNEQRVGRVDRMNGKLETTLMRNQEAILPIYYPYLEKTLDEDQLIRFGNKKMVAEKLIDELKLPNDSKEVNFLQSFDGEQWKNFFSEPENNPEIKEPFNVKLSDFNDIVAPELHYNQQEISQIIPDILNTIQSHFGSELVVYNADENTFAGIKHKRRNGRDQPVMFILDYFEPGLHYIKKPVYVLKIVSPLTQRGKLLNDNRIFGKLKAEYEDMGLVKICLDRNRSLGERFKYYTRIDLPIILTENSEINISSDELKFAIEELIRFTDELEEKVLTIDISNEEIINESGKSVPTGKSFPSNRTNNEIERNWKRSSNNNIISRSIELDKEDVESCYLFNHQNYFMRKIYLTNLVKKEVAIYKEDALKEEMELLNKILRSS